MRRNELVTYFRRKQEAASKVLEAIAEFDAVEAEGPPSTDGSQAPPVPKRKRAPSTRTHAEDPTLDLVYDSTFGTHAPISAIAERAKVDIPIAKRAMDRLVAMGKCEREGKGRGTTYARVMIEKSGNSDA